MPLIPSTWDVLHWLLCKFIRRLLLVRIVHTQKTTDLQEILLFKVPQHVLGSVNLISALHFLKQTKKKIRVGVITVDHALHFCLLNMFCFVTSYIMQNYFCTKIV